MLLSSVTAMAMLKRCDDDAEEEIMTNIMTNKMTNTNIFGDRNKMLAQTPPLPPGAPSSPALPWRLRTKIAACPARLEMMMI